jgi:hypothetical protein
LAKLPQTKPIECATVGWLLRDDDEAKVVCQSIGDLGSIANAQASGIMTIPSRCVLSIETLSEATATAEEERQNAPPLRGQASGSMQTRQEFEPLPA